MKKYLVTFSETILKEAIIETNDIAKVKELLEENEPLIVFKPKEDLNEGEFYSKILSEDDKEYITEVFSTQEI